MKITTFLNELIYRPVVNFFKNTILQIEEINRKYSKPQLKSGRPVKFCLFVLAVYLFILVGIILYKFCITVIK